MIPASPEEADLHRVDLSPLLAEGGGAVAPIPPFEVAAELDDEHFVGGAALQAGRTNRGVRIWGAVRGSQAGLCARCLAPVTAAIVTSLDEEAVDERHAEGEALRIGSGNSVDVGRLALDALDLARHLILRCDPPCPERCGACGGEHPLEACPQRDGDPRLAGLAALLPKEGDVVGEIG